MIAPESFALDDFDGHSTAVTEDVPPDREEQVIEAMASCPERAIFVDGKNSASEAASRSEEAEGTRQ